MHRALLSLILSSLAGCYTIRTVPRDGVAPLARGGHQEELLLPTTQAGRAVRVGPLTRVRFLRWDGSPSPWVRAWHLSVSDGTLSRPHYVPVQEALAIEVTGLPAGGEQLLRGTAPPEAAILRGRDAEALQLGAQGDAIILRAPPAALGRWIALTALLLAGAEYTPQQLAQLFDHDRERTMDFLRLILWKKDVGRWRFLLPGLGWQGPFTGRALHGALRGGIRVPDTIRLREVACLQVAELDLGKTTVGLVAGTPVMLGTAALAMAVGRLSHPVLEPVGQAVADQFDSGAIPGPSVADGPLPGRTLATVAAPPAPERAPLRLFAGGPRRRAVLRVVASAESLADPLRRDTLLSGATLALRFADIVELGLGGRHLLVQGDGGLSHRFSVVARLGLNLDLDLRRRFAIPLFLDAGGGGTSVVRFGAGLRIRPIPRLLLSAYLFNPTYLGAVQEAPRQRRWSFPSGIELGAVL